MTEIVFVSVVILIFSAVQSIFGVGLLLFGTPIFLIYGFSFFETIFYLAPPSLLISALQVFRGYSDNLKNNHNYLYVYCLPFIFIGMFLSTYLEASSVLNFLIGMFLFVIAVLRFSNRLNYAGGQFFEKNASIMHVIIGTVHGLTNLGGSLLVLVMPRKSDQKESTRYRISFYYLTFSIIQFFTILIFKRPDFNSNYLVLFPVLAFFAFVFSEKNIYQKYNDKKYRYFLNCLLLSISLLILSIELAGHLSP
jgi:hypothetical protein